ncbi:MAG TPA: TldD/PmbA family protein [Acidimicrobiales bacterium]|nr:TldD/PmbA family protein [Acidimicrobiales bacterium]
MSEAAAVPTAEDELLELAGKVAAEARGTEQVEAFATSSTSTSVRVHGGDIESLTRATTAGIGVRVVQDGRQGFAYAGSLDPAVVADVLAEARDNARYAQPEGWVGLATPDGVAPADIDLWRDGAVALPTSRKVEMALALERAVGACDRRIVGVRVAQWADGAGAGAVATSTGIAVTGRSTGCHLAVQALARDGDETTTGDGVSVGREPGDLDVDAAAEEAAVRTTRLLGARQPASGTVTLVLEPRMAATLVSVVAGTLDGESVLKGRSPFADRVGQQIASPLLTLVDDPTDPRSLGADRHDGEGLATRRVRLVEGGVLQGFLHNTATGRRAGVPSTASAVRSYRSTPGVGAQALAVAPGRSSLEELVAGVDHGVLVQSMSGLHSGINPVSGDFSVGVEGLMVRAGATAEPVREATVASTLQRLLLDVVAVGRDVEWTPGGTGAVALVIPGVTLSGA